MLCCKIVADFNADFDFDKLMKTLSSHGGVLYSGDILYFGSTEMNFDQKTLKKLLKKCGIAESVVFAYDAQRQPQESERVNGWLEDWLVKMEAEYFTKTNQERLQKISSGLDVLLKEVDAEIQRMTQDTPEGDKDTEDGGK